MTIGHELSGQVVKTGAGVENIKEGDWVSAEGHLWCGQCYRSDREEAYLPACQIIGVDRDGCFDYVVLPAQNLWKLHPDLDPSLASVFDPATHGALHHVLELRGKECPGGGLRPHRGALCDVGQMVWG